MAETETPDAPTDYPIGTWFWHVHHEVLAEPLYAPLSDRIAAINEWKPEDERETRLRLLTPVENVPQELVDATTAFDAAVDASVAVYRQYDRVASEEAQRARIEARLARNDAHTRMIAVKDAMTPTLDELHATQHPDCPWNGETIFPDKPTSAQTLAAMASTRMAQTVEANNTTT